MSWKRSLKRLTANWPPFSTTGEIHVHGVIVDYDGVRKNPLSEGAFINAIVGPVDQSSGLIPVKQFYEDVSRGKLQFGNVTAERFAMASGEIDVNAAYEQFFREASKGHRVFAPRTHFMFALDKSGASAPHKNYVLHFDASMPNCSTIIHEFGHNLGLMHATTVNSDRGDESDRMGARRGFIEFNAPNLVFLKWLDESDVKTVTRSGDYELTPLEFSNEVVGVPRVVTVRISESNFLYLSVRDRIGPYDSRHLDVGYARKLSIHTRSLDVAGKPKKTCLLAVQSEGEHVRFDDPTLLDEYGEIEVSEFRNTGGSEFQFHIELR